MSAAAAATRIPALDGWRALSILLVLVGHLVNYRYAHGQPIDLAAYLAVSGVKVFFVISGFLITGLALREEAATGTFSVRGFFRRRVFRILPAYFVYLAVVLLLALAGVIQQETTGVGLAAVFACNLPGVQCGWFAGHTWSLAYEEQFYLLFPLLFLLTPVGHKARLFTLIHVLLAASPLVTLLVLPASSATEEFRTMVSHFGCISAGVLFACHRTTLQKLDRHRTVLNVLAIVCVLFCIMMGSGKGIHLSFEWRRAIEALVLPVALAWLIYRSTVSDGGFTRLLDRPAIAYVGRMSYSLYLWQQLFTSAPVLGELSVLWLLPAAWLSYHFIEQPMVRLGHRIRPARRPVAAAPRGAEPG